MGLATIDPHSVKEHIEFHKTSSLAEIDPIISKIQPFENVKIYKEMYDLFVVVFFVFVFVFTFIYSFEQ